MDQMHAREQHMSRGIRRLPVAMRRLAASSTARRFVLFVGYPRSGHSLVGQLLNAHPRAIVSHEVHAGRLVQAVGFGRTELFDAILSQEHDFQDRLDRRWTGFDYTVPGAWQGRTWFPLVVGDKKGGGTTRLLRDHPDLIRRVADAVRLPVAVIHVLRNPLDNIASMARHQASARVETVARRWVAMNQIVEAARQRGDWEVWSDVRLDDLTDHPAEVLDRVRSELGLPPNERWLRASAALVREVPSRSRTEISWPPHVLEFLSRAAPL